MILAVLIDGDGRPVCSEMWPGNVADVTTLIPVSDRLRQRFAIGRICVVADRGMLSAQTIAELEARELLYLLATRERTDKVVRDVVLADTAPYVPLAIAKRGHETDYEAKAVTVGAARYIVCRNHREAAKALKAELEQRIAALGRGGSWSEIRADLDSLTETEIVHDGKRFRVRAAPRPAASLALRAAGVALPPTVQALAAD